MADALHGPYNKTPRHAFNTANKPTSVEFMDFEGYAYDLDVWFLKKSRRHPQILGLLVCDVCANPRGRANWSFIKINEDGNLFMGDNDVIVTMPHMVEIYNLWKEDRDG